MKIGILLPILLPLAAGSAPWAAGSDLTIKQLPYLFGMALFDRVVRQGALVAPRVPRYDRVVF